MNDLAQAPVRKGLLENSSFFNLAPATTIPSNSTVEYPGNTSEQVPTSSYDPYSPETTQQPAPLGAAGRLANVAFSSEVPPMSVPNPANNLAPSSVKAVEDILMKALGSGAALANSEELAYIEGTPKEEASENPEDTEPKVLTKKLDFSNNPYILNNPFSSFTSKPEIQQAKEEPQNQPELQKENTPKIAETSGTAKEDELKAYVTKLLSKFTEADKQAVAVAIMAKNAENSSCLTIAITGKVSVAVRLISAKTRIEIQETLEKLYQFEEKTLVEESIEIMSPTGPVVQKTQNWLYTNQATLSRKSKLLETAAILTSVGSNMILGDTLEKRMEYLSQFSDALLDLIYMKAIQPFNFLVTNVIENIESF
jgi:flagellar motor protein MotB